MQGFTTRVYKTFEILAAELNQMPCRGCGAKVKMLEDVCPECGAYGPLRVPCSMAINTAFFSIATILVIRTIVILVRA